MAGKPKRLQTPARTQRARGESGRAKRGQKGKRGRPSLAQVEAINAAILTHARTLFLDAGYEQTSMEDVAVRAGVTKPTLYARYASKEALYRAVIIAELQRLASQPIRHSTARKGKNLKERLRAHARFVTKALRSPDMLALRKLYGDNGRPAKMLLPSLRENERKAVAMIADDIVEGARAFRSPPKNPTRIAEMLLTAIYGWQNLEHERPLKDALDYADHLVDVLYAARHSW